MGAVCHRRRTDEELADVGFPSGFTNLVLILSAIVFQCHRQLVNMYMFP